MQLFHFAFSWHDHELNYELYFNFITTWIKQNKKLNGIHSNTRARIHSIQSDIYGPILVRLFILSFNLAPHKSIHSHHYGSTRRWADSDERQKKRQYLVRANKFFEKNQSVRAIVNRLFETLKKRIFCVFASLTRCT